jgi:hypothetical protein
VRVLRFGGNALFGEYGDAGFGYRQEAAGDVPGEFTVGALDAYLAWLGELTQERRVAGQYSEFALGRASDDHVDLAGPDLPLYRDQIHMYLPRHFLLLSFLRELSRV